MSADKIILRPIITEKTYALQEKGVYTFEVAWEATKPQIKKAVEQLFGVKVKRVRTLRQYGKRKIIYRRRGNPLEGKKSHRKKAYVTLMPGYTIDIYKGV